MKMTITDVDVFEIVTTAEIAELIEEQRRLGITIIVTSYSGANGNLEVTIEGPATDVMATMEQWGYDM